jgi:hypothetical protein
MIILTKDIQNTIILTLTEKGLTNSDVTLQITNDNTKEILSFTISDVSLYKDRYNKFIINEEMMDLTSTKYTYKVYDMNNLLETGILNVIGDDVDNPNPSLFR